MRFDVRNRTWMAEGLGIPDAPSTRKCLCPIEILEVYSRIVRVDGANYNMKQDY